ncbi:glycoside hydrolase family 88 protein [Clostridium sp. Marseille-P2415]|uniref:glycoside hydrolase family 88 protein n=1 Tax=Clostridium sp. Marseille-P2415 TaxID=1805471 RepID=UPI0009885C53|nr:glycoside hydrolase family 88 protein [Clostridium sp. Marseille-P2415]
MKAEYQDWAAQSEARILSKLEKVAERNQHKIPYTAVNGIFDDCSGEKIGWWTNGFFAGIMWFLYDRTGNQIGLQNAVGIEEKLDANFLVYDDMDHDNGFKWLPTAVADYEVTGSAGALNRALLAASNLAGRYNPAGGFIRAWNDRGSEDHRGYAIIDCMMNLPLLYRAFKHTKDPRFYQIAVHHADTAMKSFVRPEGSVAHIIEFDPETGRLVKSHKGQGYVEGSAWTRGQGWGIYGFTLSYKHTKKQEYLDTACRIAEYYLDHIPEIGLIPIDFCQPETCTWEDSSAAAVAASGLLELAVFVKGEEKDRYEAAAVRLLKTLAEKRCRWEPDMDHFLEKCSASYKEPVHEYPIIYGDFYFIEAILKINRHALDMW